MRFSELADGVAILAKYQKERDAYCVQAEHDQLWACSDELPISSEDRAALVAMGWFTDVGSWSHYT